LVERKSAVSSERKNAPENAPDAGADPGNPEQGAERESGYQSVQEAHDRAREDEARRVEAGELLSGTKGGVPDPSIQPGTGTVTDPLPGQQKP
jgi:hypothetical protein